MKSFICLLVASITLSSSLILASPPKPMPSFLPSTPPETKAMSAYTAADVLGIISTNADQLPLGHPYIAEKKYTAGIKASWPGAKVSTNIDVLVQIVLDAPPVTDPLLPMAKQIGDAWCNIEVILFKVMDVADTDKVDALLRVINAQADPSKRTGAKVFGWRMFDRFLDPRLLALRLDELDDATVYTEMFKASEEAPRRKSSARKDARDYFLSQLQYLLGMTIDETPFEVADEAAGCAALKEWLTTNWAQITAKCAEVKAKPDRKIPDVHSKVWDVRW